MSIKASESPRRPGLGVILRWTCAIVVLGLLMVTLLALPFRLYAVQTDSMTPTFASRAMVVIRLGEYKQGQPIAFNHGGVVTTHRFISVNRDGTLATKGDANRTVDPWDVKRSEVIGGEVAAVPELGYWMVFFKSVKGATLLVLLGVGLTLLFSLRESRTKAAVGPVKQPPLDTVRIDQ